MYAVCVTFDVRPEALAVFIQRIRRQAADSLRLEPGCHRFDVWTDGAKGSAVFLYEVYTDRRAFEDHLASAHFKAFDRETADIVTAKRIDTWANLHNVEDQPERRHSDG